MSVLSTSEVDLINQLVNEGVNAGRRSGYARKKWRFFHRQNLTTDATGALAAGTKLQFFGNFSIYNDMATNFPANGQLPAGEFFVIKKLWLRPVLAVAYDGSAAAGGGGALSGSAKTPHIQSEYLRMLSENGVVQLRHDNRDWVKFAGLNAFPAGRGVDGVSSMDGQTAGTLVNTTQLQYGVPALANMYELQPFLVRSGETIDFNVSFPTAVTLHTAAAAVTAGFLEAGLEGDYFHN